MNSISSCLRLKNKQNKHVYFRERARSSDVRMTRGLDEIETSVNSVINHLLSVYTVFLLEIGVEAGLDVFDDGFPAFIVVDEITKPRSVNNSQAETHTTFFNV
jgi:hypothetical protein